MLSLKASGQRMQFSMVLFIYTKFKHLHGPKVYKVYNIQFEGKCVCRGSVRACVGVMSAKPSAYSGKGGGWDL